MTFEISDSMTHNSSRVSDRAVSPVIGVILMVAITVILAAVIGVFVMGLGDEIGNTAPTVTLDVEENTAAIDQFDLAHSNGDDLNEDDLTLLIDGSTATVADWDFAGGELTPGETATVSVDSGETTAGEVDYDISVRHDPSGTVLVEEEDVTIDGGA